MSPSPNTFRQMTKPITLERAHMKRKQKKRPLKPANTATLSIGFRNPVWGTTNLALFPRKDPRHRMLLRYYMRYLPRIPSEEKEGQSECKQSKSKSS